MYARDIPVSITVSFLSLLVVGTARQARIVLGGFISIFGVLADGMIPSENK
jgi:hypothetical protein